MSRLWERVVVAFGTCVVAIGLAIWWVSDKMRRRKDEKEGWD